MPNRVHNAALSDLETIRNLNALLRTGVEGFYWDSDRYLRAAIARRRCFVIRMDGEARAVLIVDRDYPEKSGDGRCLAVETLVVEPRYRGEGLGTELVEFAKRLSYEQDKRLYVESFYEYGKPDYYRKIGFKPDEPGAYRGRPYHVLHFDPRPIPAFPRMKRIGIGDRIQYQDHLRKARAMSREVTFENLFIHDDPSRRFYLSLLHGNIVSMEPTDAGYRLYPLIGPTDIDRTLLDCLGWLRQQKQHGRFIAIPVDVISRLAPRTRAKLRFARGRAEREYVYDLRGLYTSDKFGPKAGDRDLAAFLRRGPVLTTPVASPLSGRVGCTGRPGGDDRSSKQGGHARAMRRALAYSALLGLVTGCLRVDDEISGICVAGIERNVGFMYFEQTVAKRGARQALARYFGEELLRRGVEAINRDKSLARTGHEGAARGRRLVRVVEKRSLEPRPGVR